jgi:hypothetical protein
VNPDGSDANSGDNTTHALQTITAALGKAGPVVTVHLAGHPTPYKGGVAIAGSPGSNVIIVGPTIHDAADSTLLSQRILFKHLSTAQWPSVRTAYTHGYGKSINIRNSSAFKEGCSISSTIRPNGPTGLRVTFTVRVPATLADDAASAGATLTVSKLNEAICELKAQNPAMVRIESIPFRTDNARALSPTAIIDGTSLTVPIISFTASASYFTLQNVVVQNGAHSALKMTGRMVVSVKQCKVHIQPDYASLFTLPVSHSF